MYIYSTAPVPFGSALSQQTKKNGFIASNGRRRHHERQPGWRRSRRAARRMVNTAKGGSSSLAYRTVHWRKLKPANQKPVSLPAEKKGVYTQAACSVCSRRTCFRSGRCCDCKPKQRGSLPCERKARVHLYRVLYILSRYGATGIVFHKESIREEHGLPAKFSVGLFSSMPLCEDSEAVLGVWLPAPLPTPRALPDHGAIWPLAVGVEKDLGGIDV